MYKGFRGKGYLPLYFHLYRILSKLLPGIWDTVFNILVTFSDIEYLGKLITGIFASLQGILACLLHTLVNVNALVVATTSWWLHFSAPVVALKVKKSIRVDFIIYL